MAIGSERERSFSTRRVGVNFLRRIVAVQLQDYRRGAWNEPIIFLSEAPVPVAGWSALPDHTDHLHVGGVGPPQ